MLRYVGFVFGLFICNFAIASELVNIGEFDKVDSKLTIYNKKGEGGSLCCIYVPAAFVPQAQDHIKQFMGNRPILMSFPSKKKNRHNYYTGHVYSGGIWLQQSLVENGLAYVYPAFTGDLNISQLYGYEQKARIQQLGIWQDTNVYNAKTLAGNYDKLVGSFIVVSGKVTNTAKISDKIFINFSDDWRTDYTLVIRKKNAKYFKAIDLKNLKGKYLRSRGWLESYNGPMIQAYNGLQIEVF